MGELWRRLSYLFHRRAFDRDLDEEMRFHLELKREKTGDPRRARRQFGNVGQLQEESRNVCGWASLERFWQDV